MTEPASAENPLKAMLPQATGRFSPLKTSYLKQRWQKAVPPPLIITHSTQQGQSRYIKLSSGGSDQVLVQNARRRGRAADLSPIKFGKKMNMVDRTAQLLSPIKFQKLVVGANATPKKSQLDNCSSPHNQDQLTNNRASLAMSMATPARGLAPAPSPSP